MLFAWFLHKIQRNAKARKWVGWFLLAFLGLAVIGGVINLVAAGSGHPLSEHTNSDPTVAAAAKTLVTVPVVELTARTVAGHVAAAAAAAFPQVNWYCHASIYSAVNREWVSTCEVPTNAGDDPTNPGVATITKTIVIDDRTGKTVSIH